MTNTIDDENEKRRDKDCRAEHKFYRTHKTDKNNNADLGDMNENLNTVEPMASESRESNDNGVSSTTSEPSLTIKLPINYYSGSQGKGW